MEAEEKNIDLLAFHKIGKNGTPYDTIDVTIANYITQDQLQCFVMDGQPYLYRRGYYIRDEDGKILKAHIKSLIVQELATSTRINRIYALIIMDYRLSKKSSDINRYPTTWINFQNGMYDLLNDQMYKHDPGYFSINQIPHTYDPTADFNGSIAQQFFEGLIPDQADREMFFAYAGYCMTMDTHFQKFLVMTGAPGSGKSTAINMLIDMIGTRNTCGIALQELGERFTATELLGKLLNACADLPKKALEQVDAVKRITGEDQIKGEYKGGKMFWFRSYAKLIFSANQMPKSYDEKTTAFFRRLLMINISKKGPQIENLKEGLARSMPAFICRCVQSIRVVYAAGVELDSPNSKRLVHEYYRNSDSVTAFMEDCTERANGSRIERKKLFNRYEEYCTEEQLKALSRNRFYEDLETKGYIKTTYHGVRCFKDICWKGAMGSVENTPESVFVQVDCTQEIIPFD